MSDDTKVTTKQQALIEVLITGEQPTVAALACKVPVSTYYRWMKKPAFRAALRQAQQSMFEEKLGVLRIGVSTALATLQRNMEASKPPMVQVLAAKCWLETAISLHKMSQLETEVDELRQMLLVRDASEWME